MFGQPERINYASYYQQDKDACASAMTWDNGQPTGNDLWTPVPGAIINFTNPVNRPMVSYQAFGTPRYVVEEYFPHFLWAHSVSTTTERLYQRTPNLRSPTVIPVIKTNPLNPANIYVAAGEVEGEDFYDYINIWMIDP